MESRFCLSWEIFGWCEKLKYDGTSSDVVSDSGSLISSDRRKEKSSNGVWVRNLNKFIKINHLKL